MNEQEKELMRKSLDEIRRLKKQVSSMSGNNNKDVAIIGMACRFPGGISNVHEFWKAICEQKCMILEPNKLRSAQYVTNSPYTSKAGFLTEDIDDFDCKLFRISPQEAEGMDPQQKILMKVSWEALENASYMPDKQKGSNTGVFIGASQVDYSNYLSLYRKTDNKLDSKDVTGAGFSFLSGRIAYYFGFQGAAVTIDTACSSSLVAVQQACSSLLSNDCEMALAGGINILYSSRTTQMLAEMNILSKNCELRAFDDKANGTVRGEGCGIVVLKKLSAAIADHDHIYSIIKGGCINQDGCSAGLTSPYQPAQEMLLKGALRKSNVDISQIDYLETHGTGTAIGDTIEINAIGNVYSSRTKHNQKPLYIGTVKSNVGHLEAAAGIAGLIKASLVVKHKIIPGNCGFEIPSRKIEWNGYNIKVAKKNIEVQKSTMYAGVSAFGLSGTNAHIILGTYNEDEGTKVYNIKGEKSLFKFSAVSQDALKNQLFQFKYFIEHNYMDASVNELKRISFAWNTSRADLSERTIIIANTIKDLLINLDDALANKKSNDILVGSKKYQQILFMFTGQGSQYKGMCKELYKSNKIFKMQFDECCEAFNDISKSDLKNVVFEDNEYMNFARNIQPALFSVEYSMAKSMMYYGIKPDIVLGHSIGEYVAAAIAGVFSVNDAIKLLYNRGKLMENVSGKMLAVSADKTTIKKIMDDNDIRIDVAVENSLSQTVLSGTDEEIFKCKKLLEDSNIDTIVLKVNSPFHSHYMEAIIDEFREVAKKIRYNSPNKTIISNVTGKAEYELFTDSEYWCKHILSEVNFKKSIQNIRGVEIPVFIEIGPKSVLCRLVCENIDRKDQCIFASINNNDSVSEQFLYLIGSLYSHGIDLDWNILYPAGHSIDILLPNYAFEDKHYSLNENMDEVISGANKKEEILMDDKKNEIALSISNDDDVMYQLLILLYKYMKINASDIGEDDNLLLYGLDSIIMLKIVNDLQSIYSIKVNLADFMTKSTLRQWKHIIKKMISNNEEQGKLKNEISFVSNSSEEFVPFKLNDVQNAYCIGRNDELELGGNACMAYFEIDMMKINITKFRNALGNLVKRHDMLRVRINEQGMQKVCESVDLPFNVYKVSSKEDENQYLKNIRKDMSSTKIQLGEVMFKVAITQRLDGSSRIHFAIDFMICDAQSLLIFWRDLSAIYNGNKLPELHVTYRDYLMYCENKKKLPQYEQDEEYWKSRAKEFPSAPSLTVRIRNDISYNGKFVRKKNIISYDIWDKFVKKATKYSLTPSAALFSLYCEILCAWSGMDEFGVMLTVFERDPVHPQIESVIGDFTKLVLVKAQRKDTSIAENAKNLQKVMYDSLQHSSYSAIDFVKDINCNNKDNHRIYPIVFTSAIGVENSMAEDINNNLFYNNLGFSSSSTPQVFLDHQVYYEKMGVVLSWDILESVFIGNTADHMFEAYTNLVNKAAEDNDLWENIVNDVRTSNEKNIQETVNNTEKEFPVSLLYAPFKNSVKKYKEKVAIIFEGQKHNYGMLAIEANKISNYLIKRNVVSGDYVLIHMQKSFEQIASVLGVLQVGAVYIPVMYSQPTERTEFIMHKAGSKVLITDTKQKLRDDSIIQITKNDWAEENSDFEPLVMPKSSLAYVIFTSGSTGQPKGVCITHEAAMNTISVVNELLDVTEQDTILGVSALSFDLSVYDIFGLLSVGGTIVIPSESERKNSHDMYKLCSENNVTIWNSVPAIMEVYIDGLNKFGRKDMTIKSIILSGDWIPINMPQKLKQSIPLSNLYSMGGATEASIWSNYYKVSPDEKFETSIPYGYPLTNQQFYILDKFGRCCPTGVRGKLYISGRGLSVGYLNDDILTDKSFKYNKKLKKLVYETGDYGRYLENGCIEFLGREDTQIKIHGFRVELGEIENVLEQNKNVKKAIASLYKDKNGKQQICAYYQSYGGENKDFDKNKSSVVLKSVKKQSLDMENVITPNEYATIVSIMEKISLGVMINTFLNMNVFTKENYELSIESMIKKNVIAPKYKKLMYQWADSLVDSGSIIRDGNTYKALNPLVYVNIDNYFNEALKYDNINFWKDSLEFLLETNEHMIDILKSDVNPLTILFPNGGMKRAENFYRFNPVAEYFNNILAAAVEEYVKQYGEKDKISILEFGAGTGGTSAGILKRINGRDVEYMFTDLSTFFTHQAEDKFNANYNFIKYGIYNIDKYPQTQGYNLGEYDIILGANVLHDAKYLNTTLEYMYSLLSKDGMLMILELTKNKLFHKVSIGLIEGFSGYEDDRIRNNEPLISAAEWEKRMNDAGFSEVHSYPEKNNAANLFEQNVIIAQVHKNYNYVSQHELQEYAKKYLPLYMIPTNIYPLDNFPYNSNGKINRRVLPIPEYQESFNENYKAPKGKNEKMIHDIICNVLKIEKLSTVTNIFDVGCDSLKAIQIISSLESNKISLSLAQLYKSPTIKELAEIIGSTITNNNFVNYKDFRVIPMKIRDKFDLNSIQKAYLMGRRSDFSLGNISCHYYAEIDTKLNMKQFEVSLNKVIKHQPALRTIVYETGYQQVLDNVPYYSIDIIDVSEISEYEQKQKLMEYRNLVSQRIIQLGKWPLFKFTALKFSQKKFILLADIDVMIADAASFYIFGSELMHYYSKGSELPVLEFEMSDYNNCLNNYKKSSYYMEDRKYWLNRINTFSHPLTLPLKTDVVDIKVPYFERLSTKFTREEWKGLKKAASLRNVTPAVLLCTAYCKVLSWFCNKQKYAINLTIFNRYDFYDKIQDIMGDFTSTIVLEVNMKPKLTFWEQAMEMQNRFAQDIDHRSFDGIDFIKELSKRENQPVFVPIVFTCAIFDDNVKGWNDIGDMRYGISQTSQVLLDNQITVIDNELTIVWDYVKNAFDNNMIKEMYDVYINLLYDICNDENYIIPYSKSLDKIIKNINNCRDDIQDVQNITSFLQSLGQANYTKYAIIEDNNTITFKRLYEIADNMYKLILNNELSKTIIRVEGNNKILYLALILGAWKAGCVISFEETDYVQVKCESPEKIVIKGGRKENVSKLPQDTAILLSGLNVITHGKLIASVHEVNNIFLHSENEKYVIPSYEGKVRCIYNCILAWEEQRTVQFYEKDKILEGPLILLGSEEWYKNILETGHDLEVKNVVIYENIKSNKLIYNLRKKFSYIDVTQLIGDDDFIPILFNIIEIQSESSMDNCGSVIPNMKCHIKDYCGNDCPINTIGELYVGFAFSDEHLKDTKKQAAIMPDGKIKIFS